MQAELDPQEVLTVLNCAGFDAALTMIDRHPGSRLQRHAAAAFAEEVLPFFEDLFPTDPRPRRAIEVARDDNATPEERAAAFADARAAAEKASEDAGGVLDITFAAWRARAATFAARSAALAAEGGELSAWHAAWVASGAADAAAEAARSVGGVRFTINQEAVLRKMLTEGF